MIHRIAFRTIVAGVLSAVTAAVLAAAPTAPAAEPSCPMMHSAPMSSEGGMPMMGGMRGAQQMFNKLGLTAEQRGKIQALMQEQHKQRTEHRQSAHQDMMALHQLAQAPEFDATKAKQLAAERGQWMGEQIFQHLQTEAQVRAVLTPEQRKQLDEQMAAWHSKHQHHPDEHRSHHCK